MTHEGQFEGELVITTCLDPDLEEDAIAVTLPKKRWETIIAGMCFAVTCAGEDGGMCANCVMEWAVILKAMAEQAEINCTHGEGSHDSA